jgi:hypothetical protein
MYIIIFKLYNTDFCIMFMYGVKWLVTYPITFRAVWLVNEMHLYVYMYVCRPFRAVMTLYFENPPLQEKWTHLLHGRNGFLVRGT